MAKYGGVGAGLVDSIFKDVEGFEVAPAHSLNLSPAVMADTTKAKDLGLLPIGPR